MDALPRPNGDEPSTTVSVLFDQLCLRWVREADVVAQQTGTVAPTLVLLPRDKTADEVAIRLEGLRGNLSERADALLAELRPAAAQHDPAGLVFLAAMRLGPSASGPDGVVVYVSLGRTELRRAMGFAIATGTDGVARLERSGDPPDAMFVWLDRLLVPDPPTP